MQRSTSIGDLRLMRGSNFLRTPIRADHQSRLQGLTLSEHALIGNPEPGAPYPQSLIIAFTADPGATEVQIAPLWEGVLYFLAEDTTGYPADPSDVTEAS